MLLPIASDCYDEITLSCEKHQEATLIGISNIFNRSTIIFQALLIGIIHIMTGYNQFPNAVQTPLAMWGVRIHRALIPAILCFISCILMLLWYDLKGEKKLALKVRLREKGL
jgi:Na+/melibiose symporter-like transporter